MSNSKCCCKWESSDAVLKVDLTILVHVVEYGAVFSSKEALHFLLEVTLHACTCSYGGWSAHVGGGGVEGGGGHVKGDKPT